jgi:hypothetical protein
MREKNPELHRVSKWEPVYLQSQDSARKITTASTQYQKDLAALANYFVKDILHLDITPSTKVYDVLQFALCFYKHAGSAQEQLDDWLHKNLPTNLISHLKTLLENVLVESSEQTLYASPCTGTTPTSIPGTTPLTMEEVVDDNPPPPKKKARVINNNNDNNNNDVAPVDLNDLTLRDTVKATRCNKKN